MSRLTQSYHSPRRALGETLTELVAGVMAAASPGLTRATSIELRLPLELSLGRDGVLTGDLPLYRRATAFDAPPAQVTVTLAEQPLDEATGLLAVTTAGGQS